MRLILFITLFGLGLALPARAQNIVANGDFEIGPYDVTGMVTGWMVGGTGKVSDASGEGGTSGMPPHVAAFNVGGNTDGNILSQNLATTPGGIYTLDFDAAVFGTPDTGSTLQLRVQAIGNVSLLDQTITPPVSNSFNAMDTFMNFNQYHFTFMFTADSSSTTLQFSDSGLGNASSDTVLDTVVVVPEPSTAGLMLFGAGSLLGLARFNRRR